LRKVALDSEERFGGAVEPRRDSLTASVTVAMAGVMKGKDAIDRNGDRLDEGGSSPVKKATQHPRLTRMEGLSVYRSIDLGIKRRKKNVFC